MLLSPEERVQKALQLFDLMEKFVERARQPPMSDQPLVYDPGDDDLPVLVVPNQKSGFPAASRRTITLEGHTC